MSRKKDLIMVIDTETAGSIADPLCYDVGWLIMDRQGTIYQERNFVVADIYLDERELMKSCYYAEKLPKYEQDLREKKRLLKTIYSVKKIFYQDLATFNVSKIAGYNIGFDKKALNNTIKYVSNAKTQWFFPLKVHYLDIWNMACSVILTTPSYIKYAVEHRYISEAGNILTNAEVCYRFIKDLPDFIECHTGLEDCRIESEILVKCYKKHKKLETGIDGLCWRKVQKKRAEMKI